MGAATILFDRYRVKITFLEPILGAIPGDPDLYEDYILRKAEEAGISTTYARSELETIPDVERKGKTIFHRVNGDTDGDPLLYDYVVRGFFKAACGALRRSKKTKSSDIAAYKKVVDTNVFVEERHVVLQLPDGAETGELVRPLRADTAQGERVALANSETAPAGTSAEFTVKVLAGCKVNQDVLEEWLAYGRYHGLGQWRSGGWGIFEYEIEQIA
jgi:hypothetical protein